MDLRKLWVWSSSLLLVACSSAFGCEYINTLSKDYYESSLLWEKLEKVRKIEVDPRLVRGESVDDFSLTCLGCHGGSLLPGWNIRLYHSGNDAAGSHKIGTNYITLSWSGARLRPPEVLDPRITLVNGRVGCVSCHDPFNPEGLHLVMPNNGSRLCLSCHTV